MILFPAIDLKDGQCVRLEQGDMARVTVFNNDPGEQAAAFAAQGFSFTYCRFGRCFCRCQRQPPSSCVNCRACQAADITSQLGGGIRSLKNIEAWLAAGIDRVILGTMAQRDGFGVASLSGIPRAHHCRH